MYICVYKLEWRGEELAYYCSLFTEGVVDASADAVSVGVVCCRRDLDFLNSSSCCRSSSSSERPEFLNLESLRSLIFCVPLNSTSTFSRIGMKFSNSSSRSAVSTCSGAIVFFASFSAISEDIEERIIRNSMPERMIISRASLLNERSPSSISEMSFCTVAFGRDTSSLSMPAMMLYCLCLCLCVCICLLVFEQAASAKKHPHKPTPTPTGREPRRAQTAAFGSALYKPAGPRRELRVAQRGGRGPARCVGVGWLHKKMCTHHVSFGHVTRSM